MARGKAVGDFLRQFRAKPYIRQDTTKGRAYRIGGPTDTAMKYTLIITSVLLSIGTALAQQAPTAPETTLSKFATLSVEEKREAARALANGECEYKGIRLWGKVQFVTAFPDIKIQYVDAFPDLKVKFVQHFPDECGLWQVTEHFPDIKVQVVTSFPDIKVKVVEHFPGVD